MTLLKVLWYHLAVIAGGGGSKGEIGGTLFLACLHPCLVFSYGLYSGKTDYWQENRVLLPQDWCSCFVFQHRMRPEIAQLLSPHIYQELENHPSVLKYENVKVSFQ